MKTPLAIPATQRLLTEKQAAQFIGVNLEVMRRSRREGVLFSCIPHPPHLRFGRSIRYSPVAILKHLEEYADEGGAQINQFLDVAYSSYPEHHRN